MRIELRTSSITRASAGFDQGTTAWQRPVEARNSGSRMLGSGIYSSLVLSAALTRCPLAAGGVLGQAKCLG